LTEGGLAACDAFIDIAVAIVIKAIAGLFSWGDLGLTSTPTTVFLAFLDTGGAQTDVEGVLFVGSNIITRSCCADLWADILTTLIIEIDQAVTIVIFAVGALAEGFFGAGGDAFFFDFGHFEAIAPKEIL
jgi:hypothetical protein